MMWKMLGYKLFLCLCCVAVSIIKADDSDSKVVKTVHGAVRGYLDPEGGLYVFYGIPYATAPIGEQKFMAPLPPPMWLNTLEAVDKRVICPQPKSQFTEDMNMQEDCLILNVYVPNTETKNLPVIVYVHGGAFQLGHGNLLMPKQLVMNKNVIVVTFNYRLGAHGFLCLGTNDAPGNAGLKDQVTALKWVNKNINKFGGNPQDVTIAGYSAGASSVDLLAISRPAKNLFHKVIIESGSNLMGASVVADPLENAKIFAANMGFTDVNDVYALENFYKQASFETLTKASTIDRLNSTLIFAPCIERDTEDEEFLTDAPLDILKKGKYQKVPMLYGFANMEGLFRVPLFDTWKDKMNEKFYDFLPGDLQFESDQQREEVAEKVKQYYFKDAVVNEDNILSYIDYFGDVMFKYPVLRTVQMHLENGHNGIYLYEYTYADEESPVVPHTNARGADHCGETLAVLDIKNENSISDEYKKVKNVIRDFWTNFAKTNRPVVEDSELPGWPAVSTKASPYMEIAVTPQLHDEPLSPRVRFWDDVYERYYRMPTPPPPPPSRHTEL